MTPLSQLSLFTLTSYCTFFFFNDTAPPEIYTLSLHDALPIWNASASLIISALRCCAAILSWFFWASSDRKSTRLNSSHTVISYAVFCLKKKKTVRDLSFVRSVFDADG